MFGLWRDAIERARVFVRRKVSGESFTIFAPLDRVSLLEWPLRLSPQPSVPVVSRASLDALQHETHTPPSHVPPHAQPLTTT